MQNATNTEVLLCTDGGSRGNPGPSASGYVIFSKDGKVLVEDGEYLGITTNNQAEYHAVRLGLERALDLGATRIDVSMDSQLVVRQISGQYRVKNRDLLPIYLAIHDLIKKFEEVTFKHVYREFNKEADAMVNKILDEHKHENN